MSPMKSFCVPTECFAVFLETKSASAKARWAACWMSLARCSPTSLLYWACVWDKSYHCLSPAQVKINHLFSIILLYFNEILKLKSGVTSQYLAANEGVSVPTLQSTLNYCLLLFCYLPYFIYLRHYRSPPIPEQIDAPSSEGKDLIAQDTREEEKELPQNESQPPVSEAAEPERPSR